MHNKINKISASEWESTENTYSNPLFQSLQSPDFTEENFHIYQKDIGNILVQLMNNIDKFWWDITEKNIDDDWRVEKNMHSIDIQCKLLWEYCLVLARHTGKMFLPYEYLWDIAHKLKTYALTTRWFITLYMEEVGTEKKQNTFKTLKDSIKTMIRDVWKASNHIQNIEFNIIPYTKSVFSPIDVTNDTLKLQKPFIEEKKITIKNMLPEDYKLDNYKEIFEIVINNLITNAVKFTPQWGKISIGIEKENEYIITFFVEDSWMGIPADVDVFKHGYITPSTEWQQWTWLGLTQSKVFLNIIRGDIQHKNNTPSWTIFYFSIRK